MIGGHDADVLFKDVTITDNKGTHSTTSAAAVYVTDIEDIITFEGKVVIDNNYIINGSAERNIFAQNNKEEGGSTNVITFHISNLSTDSRLSIYTLAGDYSDANRLIAADAMPSSWGNIIMADSYGQYVKLDNTKPLGEQFYFSFEHTHCLCGHGDNSACDHMAKKWGLWEKTDSLPTANGYYALTSDIVLTSAFNTSTGSDIHLCLNGHNITSVEGISCRSLIRGNYSISDCKAYTNGNGDYISGCFTGFSDGVLSLADSTGARLTIFDATFCYNTRSTAGCVIYVGHDDELNIYRAKINNNTAEGSMIRSGLRATVNIWSGRYFNNDATTSNGGLLSAYKDTKVNIYGGEYYNNNAVQGGTFFFSNGSIGNINNGVFRNNTATYAPVAIVLRDAILTMNGGDYYGNVASSSGGAIYSSVGSRLYINGGNYTNNKATKKGGVLFGDRTVELIITGGNFSKNEAQFGGAIGTSAIESFVMNGGSVKNNKATSGGGGIHFASGTVKDTETGKTRRTPTYATVSGIKISGNTALNAGGLLADPATVVTVKNCTISGNTASSAGGGLYVNKCTFKMIGSTISNNTATKSNAGGLYNLQATTTIEGGTFAGNTSSAGYGGGIYANGGGVNPTNGYGHGYLTVSGTTLRNNTGKWAGAICLGSTAKCTVSGCTIRDNKGTGTGAILIQSENTDIKLRNTTFKNNIAEKTGGGAMYASYKTTFSISNCKFIENESTTNRGGALVLGGRQGSVSGCSFTGNKSKGDGGAVSVIGCLITISDSTFTENYAGGQAGAVCVSKTTVDKLPVYGQATIKNCTFNKNVSEKYGGGCMVQGQSFCTIQDSSFDGNSAKYGGAIGNGAGTFTVDGCVMSNNTAEIGGAVRTGANTNNTINNTEIYGNKATVEYGGGIASYAVLKADGLNVHDNEAVMGGGGIGIHKGSVATISNSIIKDNKTPGEGGGIAVGAGGVFTLSDSTVTGNSSETTGGGIYADYGIGLIGDVITGNTAKNVGGVHVVSGKYDGMSLVRGIHKIGGNLVIKDNEGEYSGMYIEKDTIILVDQNTLGKDAFIHVNLEQGKITKTVLGAYNYEGGNYVYDLTYGDKSMTEVEPDPTEPSKSEQEAAESVAESSAAESTEATEESSEGISAGAIIGIIASAAVVIGGGVAIGVSSAKKKKKVD